MFQPYTLEKHLEATASDNQNAKILHSIWQMNKSHLPKAMDAITMNFPNFSLHEKSHCDTIIKNIEAFLGEDRIEKLSPTDTWLILMSAYTHDLGMVIFYRALEEKWVDKEFDEFIVQCSKSGFDKTLAESAQLIIELKNITINGNKSSFSFDHSSPLKIRNAVSLINAEFYRKNHHIRSKEILKGLDGDFNRLSNTFYCDQLPNRFIKLLGEIAYGHGVNFEHVFESMHYKANGFCSDFCHPRFVSCMLRLGDILDVDDKRFNMFMLEAFDKNTPTISGYHLKKHASVEHLLINPTSIEAELDCPDENSYRISRDWFDWVLKEGKNQTNNWQEIVPENVGGFPPSVKEEKIKILYKGSTPPKELLNLKFTISTEKALSLLKGGALYDKTEFVFIREVIQNSMDAIKIQIWRDIEKGIYDKILFKHLTEKRKKELRLNNHEEITKCIAFPDDLPDDLIDNYIITLSIDWVNEKKEALQFIFKDNGCGISEDEIVRMTKNVGVSKTKEKETQAFINRMPFFLKPTGSFGIGLQSLFLVSDQFSMITASEGEKAKRIVFRNPSTGQYSSIDMLAENAMRGTSLTIEVPKDNLSSAFKNSFSMSVIDQYDYFLDGEGDQYIYKIVEYINTSLDKVPFLQISHSNNIFWKSKLRINDSLFKGDFIDLKEESNLLSELYQGNKGFYFRFIENLSELKSEVILVIFSDFEDIKIPYPDYKIKFYVRNIQVESNLRNYYSTTFCSTYWNLLGSASDKLLKVSRDKFLDSTGDILSGQYLKIIFPKIILNAHDLVVKAIEKYSEDPFKQKSFKIIYFQIGLMMEMNEVSKEKIRWDLISDLEIPKQFCSDSEYKKVYTVDEFVNLKRPAILIGKNEHGWHNTRDNDALFKEKISEFKDIIDTEKCDGIFRVPSVIQRYIYKKYNIASIHTAQTSPGYKLLLLENITPLEKIKIDVETKKVILTDLISNRKKIKADRQNIYSLSEYSDILAIQNLWFTGFEDFPKYSKSSIISPFASKSNFESWLEIIKQRNHTNEKEITKSILRDRLKEWLPNSLVDVVMQNSYNKPAFLSKKLIIDKYIELAADFIHLKLEDDSKGT